MTHEDNMTGGEQRVERLICRLLDGEISAEQRAELDAILARDADARAMFMEYRRNDVLARSALRRDMAGARTAVVARRGRRGLWLATVGGVLAAAAVIALSFLPELWRAAPGQGQPMVERGERAAPMYQQPTFVDYRNLDYRPERRQSEILRDVIGIQGENKNVIYLLERNTRATRITPISGEF